MKHINYSRYHPSLTPFSLHSIVPPKNLITMKFTILSLAAIVAVTAASPAANPEAASSSALDRRAVPILEFKCKDFPNVCKTQCYGKELPTLLVSTVDTTRTPTNILHLRCVLC